MSQFGSDGTATTLRPELSGVRVKSAARHVSLLQNVQPGCGAQSAHIHWAPRIERLSRKVKHSPPYNTEVKNEWS